MKKCSYRGCVRPDVDLTQNPMGMVDDKMRPWHVECARLVLTEYPGQHMLNTILLVVVAGMLLTSMLLRHC